MRDFKLIAIAAVIIAVILAGEAYIYTFNSDDKYNTSTSLSDGSLSYSIYSGNSNCYDVVMTDNGDFDPATDCYIYYDDRYAANLNEVIQPIGSAKLDQSYYVSQLLYQLSNRGITTTVLDADSLKTRLQNDIAADDCKKGLVVVSGALPDTVYEGNVTDTIFGWMSAGGRLYWAGNLIGSCYSTMKGIEPVIGYQELFFGVSGCLNENGPEKAYDDDSSNDYRHALSLLNNDIRYAPDTSMTMNSITMGYSDGTYSSISLIRFGEGMICIVAGDYSNNQRSDLAQVIGAQVCHKSVMMVHETGNVTRGSIGKDVSIITPSQNSVVYVYLGGYYLVNADNYCYYGLNAV